MRVYHVWLDGQKNSTQHLFRTDDETFGADVRYAASVHYGVKSIAVVSRYLAEKDLDEIKKLESYLGYAVYPLFNKTA